ncbi:MAG: hypothetical protein ACI9EF_002422 [Pseudohongiellaceae bacterium]
MNRDFLRKTTTGHKASDINTRLNRRMKAYAMGIAVILAVLYTYGNDPDVEAPTGLAKRPLGPVNAEPIDIPASANVAPLAQVKPELLESVADGSAVERSRMEPDARKHLMQQAGRLVFGDLRKLGLASAHWETLITGGAEHRGAPVWVLGTLSWWQDEIVNGYTEVRGEVIDREGRPWAFLSVTEPYDLNVGDVVKLAGFWFKAHDMLRPDGTVVTAPLIVADELLASAYPIEPVTEFPAASLEEVRDYNIVQASRPLDSLNFYELLSFADHGHPQDVLPPGAATEVMPSELLAEPGEWRGEPVSVTGVLYYMTEAPLGPRGENPIGVPFAWNLWVSDNRAGSAGTMLVISLEEPTSVKERQIVTIKGRFFRRYAFENKANHPRMAAVIIATEIEALIPEVNTLTPLLMDIILSVVGLAVVAIFLSQWRERRAMGVARKQRMRRHRGNVLRPGQLHPRQGTNASEAGPGSSQAASAP